MEWNKKESKSSQGLNGITAADFQRIKSASQKAAEKAYKNGEIGGACGFAWIKFNGVAAKNRLEKAGFEVKKDYPTGYALSVYQFYETPRTIEEGTDNNAKATWGQSIDLKEVVAETVAKMLEQEYGLECFVDSRLD